MSQIYRLTNPEADAPARAWKWQEPTGYVFFRQWETLAALHLTGQAFRLYCGLLAHTDWGNRCTAALSTIGASVGLSRSTVARVLPQLIASRVVYVDRASDPRRPVVHLNPTYVWKGRPWHRHYACAQFRAAWQLHHGQTGGGDRVHPPQVGAELPPGSHQGQFSHPFIQYEPPTELSAVDPTEVVGVRE